MRLVIFFHIFNSHINFLLCELATYLSISISFYQLFHIFKCYLFYILNYFMYLGLWILCFLISVPGLCFLNYCIFVIGFNIRYGWYSLVTAYSGYYCLFFIRTLESDYFIFKKIFFLFLCEKKISSKNLNLQYRLGKDKCKNQKQNSK